MSEAAYKPLPDNSGLRYGVAKITVNGGSGSYTVTEQRYTGAAWQAAIAPKGLVSVTARDYQDYATGVVNDYVYFWEQRLSTGVIEVLIDISSSMFPEGTTTGQMLYWNGTAWTLLDPPASNDSMYFLSMTNGVPTWIISEACS